MEIAISQEQGRVPVTIFHVTGEINTETYDQLQTQAGQSLRAGTRYLLLDLTQVSYVSSYGVRAISHVFNLLRDSSESQDILSKGLRDGTFKSPHLKLSTPTPHVLKVLTTSGIDMFLEIHTDLTSAIASF
ncbi:MAG: STAS domain-containing protein [candidate division NC10 bacterium]